MANRNGNMSCARVKTYTSSSVGSIERHDERKNQDYGNVNVDVERIPFNVHFQSPGDSSYMDILREKDADGTATLRGLRSDAKLFDEIVFDVNTMYFEEHGGYDYAKQFYEEAYRFAVEKYGGTERIISAVMHADEINKAVSAELGKNVYHYHLHVVALPVVEKEVLWSKRCKDPSLVGTVKEVVHQISHSKKWESRTPMMDMEGNPVLRKNGKPKYRPSYSVLQDEFYNHMVSHGFKDFRRGERGSTAEHLTALQYQIKKDTERLNEIDAKLKTVELAYEPAEADFKTYQEIDDIGKKNLTGKYTMIKEDYDKLTALAKEGISSRKEIFRLERDVRYYSNEANWYKSATSKLQSQYDQLKKVCQPFLEALEHFPDYVQKFITRVQDLFFEKESAYLAEQERLWKEAEKVRQRQHIRIKDRGDR